MAADYGSENPSKLVELCAEFICRNLDTFTAKSPNGTPFLRTPFTLPVVIVETILFKLNELFIRNENAIATLLHPSTCPHGLRRLRIPGSLVGPTGFDLASKSCHLFDVNLAFCRQLNDQKILHGLLPSSHTLRSLNLGHIKGQLGFEKLEEFRELRDLDLCVTDVDSVSLKRACSQMKSLRSLDVSETPISTLSVLTSVSHLSGLRSLSVHGLSLEKDEVVELRAVLREVLKNLTFLDVSLVPLEKEKANVSSEDLVSIIFSENSSLRELDISSCEIPPAKLVSMISSSPIRYQLEVLDLFDSDLCDYELVKAVAPQLYIAVLKRDDGFDDAALQLRVLKRPFYLLETFSPPYSIQDGQKSERFWRSYGDLALFLMHNYQDDDFDLCEHALDFLQLYGNDPGLNCASFVARCIDFAVACSSGQRHWAIKILELFMPAVRRRKKWIRRVGLLLVDLLRTSPSDLIVYECLHRLVHYNSADVCYYIAFECGAARVVIRTLTRLVADPSPCAHEASILTSILAALTDGVPKSGDEIASLGPDVDPVQCAANCIDRFADVGGVIECVIYFLGNVVESPHGFAAVVNNPDAVKAVLSCLEPKTGDARALSVCHFMAVLLSDYSGSFWLEPSFPSREHVCRLLCDTVDGMEVDPQDSRDKDIRYESIDSLLNLMKCSHTGLVRYFGLWMLASLCCSNSGNHYVNCLRENDEAGIAVVRDVDVDQARADHFKKCQSIILGKYSN